MAKLEGYDGKHGKHLLFDLREIQAMTLTAAKNSRYILYCYKRRGGSVHRFAQVLSEIMGKSIRKETLAGTMQTDVSKHDGRIDWLTYVAICRYAKVQWREMLFEDIESLDIMRGFNR